VTIEVSEAQEGLDFFDGSGNWPIFNGLNFSRVHRKTSGRDNVSHIFNNIDVELTFFRICKESVISTLEENFTDLSDMIFETIGFCLNDKIVEICCNKSVEKVVKCVVHEILKGCRRIGEAEVHHEELVGTVTCAECGFPFVSISNVD
jgi:hypothetical protein